MLSRKSAAGVTGGFVGGAVFGIMMEQMGLMAMIAAMVGSQAAAAAWIIHMAISAIFGLAFGVLMSSKHPHYITAAYGTAYGAVLWAIGGLLIMPAILGMPVLTISALTLASLMGHVVYGAILALVFALVTSEELRTWSPPQVKARQPGS